MLKKTPPVLIIPGTPAASERLPSVVCSPPYPRYTDIDTIPPPAAAPAPSAGYWVYVPSNTQYFVSETRVFSATYPAGDYTCRDGSYLVPDPDFAGGMKMAVEMRCYWDYV